MKMWKGLALLAALVLVYLFVPRFLPWAIVLAGLVWITTSRVAASTPVRSREEITQAHRFATALGMDYARWTRGFRFMREGWRLRVATVPEGSDGLELLDLTIGGWPVVPLCFLVRGANPPLREENLVENSRIPGTRFEYELRPFDAAAPLEGASNLPDLMGHLRDELGELARHSTGLQRLFFNGRVLHLQFRMEGLEASVVPGMVDAWLEVALGLEDVLDRVNFRAPL